jgi:flagellar protein FlgJ
MAMGLAIGSSAAEAAITAYQASASELKTKSALKSPAAIDAAAKEFEALFISQMLQQMFADVPFGSELEGDRESQDIYRSLVVDEYGKLIARSGGIGVADYVKTEMLRQQEIAQAKQAAAEQAVTHQEGDL